MNKEYQHTIKKSITVSGVGLHTGTQVDMTFHPAPANHGYKFRRTDLNSQPVIEADADLVTDTARGTTITKNGASVSTIEHTLAALVGLGIDNVMIDLNGPETPIMDGSSKEFIQALSSVGMETQDAEREYITINENITFKDALRKTEITVMPADDYQVTVMIDFDSKVLGKQHATLDHISEFPGQIANSRTFCFLHELEMLLEHNLIKGGDINNAIVVVDKPVSEEKPARHKLLDVVGDLALAGKPIKGKIIASRPGHPSNVEFAKKIKAYYKFKKNAVDVPVYDLKAEPLYDINKISKMLPHRYPFLLVDKIIEMGENHIVGVKNITFNESF